MKNLLLTLIAVLSWQLAHCQTNLIKNNSYETYSSCPIGDIIRGELDLAIPWFPATKGTPDLFNACHTTVPSPGWNPTTGVPWNYFGYQPAKSGNGYGGFFNLVVNVDTSDYDPLYGFGKEWAKREYVAIQLAKPLEKNKTYTLSYWLSLIDSASHATDLVGAYFSKTPDYPEDSTRIFMNKIPQITNPRGRFFADTSNWMLFEGTYTPQESGDEYIAIGSFGKLDTATNLQLVFTNSREFSYTYRVYYYVDLVCLVEEGGDCLIPTSMEDKIEDKNIRYDNIRNQLIIPSKIIGQKVIIYNIFGQPIKEFILESDRTIIQTDDWQTGFYFLSFYHNNHITHFNFLKQ